MSITTMSYGVRPVIWYPKDYVLPSGYYAYVHWNFLRLRRWWSLALGGATFKPIRPASVRSAKTLAEWTALYNWQGQPDGIPIWYAAMREAQARKALTICDPKRLFVLVCPAKINAGGMVGKDALGCAGAVLPGLVAMSGGGARVLGGGVDDLTQWPLQWVFGATCHEIGHALGLPHPGEIEGGLHWWSVMFNWWSWQEIVIPPGFIESERVALLASPFIGVT